jgi:hypothetical protein
MIGAWGSAAAARQAEINDPVTQFSAHCASGDVYTDSRSDAEKAALGKFSGGTGTAIFKQ